MSSKTEINTKVNPEKVPLEIDQGILESEEIKWRLPLKNVYKHGLHFYKDKEGKAMHLTYEDRLKLVAYTQQAAHGPLDQNSASPLGVLDVIGRDRRAAWQALGHMSQIQAMAGFVHNLDRLCPLFKPYLEAIIKDIEETKKQQCKKEADEKSHIELQNRVSLEQQKQQSDQLTEEQQVQRIKDALNGQTYDQFLQYAQQQHPGNVDQQAVLIRQLQDQHYQQYIQQLALDQRLANSNLNVTNDDSVTSKNPDSADEMQAGKDCNLNDTHLPVTDNKAMQTIEKTELSEAHIGDERREDEETDGEDDDGFPRVEEAHMWTRSELAPFKQSASAGGGRLAVGHGETVCIRVPTHARAAALCWEFATDHYDIGFGLYFEWSKSTSTAVTIHVADTDDEDDPDDDEEFPAVEAGEAGDPEVGDPEIGSERRALRASQRPPLSVIVPIYRRDSHLEVYAGSHTYPGEGVYLLKFDNTYSLWRSKTLYYKVYYTQ